MRYALLVVLAGCGSTSSVHPTGTSECPDGYAVISAGSFVLAPGEASTLVSKFCLAKKQVTAAEYRGCVKRGHCSDTELRCEPAATYNRPEVADHPINCVDWSQATAYCEDQGARLPTEAEWMWAARNGERATKQPWGNDAASDTNVCFSSSATPRTETCPIATFPPTALGLFDIGGNVSEWTSTPFVADFRPMPGERLIVTPGGGFGYGAASVGIIPHQFSDASVHANVLGIRCARDTAE